MQQKHATHVFMHLADRISIRLPRGNTLISVLPIFLKIYYNIFSNGLLCQYGNVMGKTKFKHVNMVGLSIYVSSSVLHVVCCKILITITLYNE